MGARSKTRPLGGVVYFFFLSRSILLCGDKKSGRFLPLINLKADIYFMGEGLHR
jgi:hypothetical protein